MSLDPLRSSSIVDPLADGPSSPNADGQSARNDPLLKIDALRRLRKLEEWFEVEKVRQAPNRYQMAIDADFYDGLQWSDEDAQVLIDRYQAPLVYNKVATTIDWITGTEKRTRVDFKVFPRSSNDRNESENKTKILKFLQDVNKGQFCRSRAFFESTTVGVGWLECGIRGDPSKELIYDRAETWRHVWYDSHAIEIDDSDARYIFRSKWVDEDVAAMCFPNYSQAIHSAAVYSDIADQQDEDEWYLGRLLSDRNRTETVFGRRTFVDSTASLFNQRPRVKLTEAWYRVPAKVKLFIGGGFHGLMFDPNDDLHQYMAAQKATSLIDRTMMRVRCGIFIRGRFIYDDWSPYRHNAFPLTPIWANRRGRDNAPYGAIRNQRDPQESFNKRMSKALHIFSSRRVFAEAGAGLDIDEIRKEAARPDSVFIFPKGNKFELKTDVDVAEHHLAYAEVDARMIQDIGGVTDELMGRKTNAVSGRAIEARQDQGSTVTTKYFDALRLGFQLHGQKLLSLIEQFMTWHRALRIIGERRGYDFLEINQPGQDAQGQPILLNDITKSQADFIVSAEDFRETIRQAAFEQLMDMAGKLPPEISIKLIDDILEFADIPGADAIIATIREINGKPPRDKILTPEEEQAIEQQKAQEDQKKQLADQLALENAMGEVGKLESEIRLNNAKAAELEAQIGQDGGAAEIEYQQKLLKIREDTAKLVLALTSKVEQAKLALKAKEAQFAQRYSTEHAKIASAERIAAADRMHQAGVEAMKLDSGEHMAAQDLASKERQTAAQLRSGERQASADRTAKERIARSAQAAKGTTSGAKSTGGASAKPAAAPAPEVRMLPAPEPAPAPHVTVSTSIDNSGGDDEIVVEKDIKFQINSKGDMTGAKVVERRRPRKKQ